jgi:CRISPR-associated protein Cmr4
MNDKRILYLFTRTPLHVGAGSSVGAIDQPIIRERHTGFPVIPATSLKGTFADEWNAPNGDGKLSRTTEGAWLFGSTDANNAAAGALQFSEARLLAFPIRSARGSFAWITCPLMLQRAARDGVLAPALLDKLVEPKDEQAIFDSETGSKLCLENQVVLEEYTFQAVPWPGLANLGNHLAELLPDPLWKEVASRLVILSNGMMSFFARNACEVAQHVRISDETGTAADRALFNQENVPSEAFFYSVIHATHERTASRPGAQSRQAVQALATFAEKAKTVSVFQFGGDASTGLGYCTVTLDSHDQGA